MSKDFDSPIEVGFCAAKVEEQDGEQEPELSEEDKEFNALMVKYCGDDFTMQAGFQRGWLANKLFKSESIAPPSLPKLEFETWWKEYSPIRTIGEHNHLQCAYAAWKAGRAAAPVPAGRIMCATHEWLDEKPCPYCAAAPVALPTHHLISSETSSGYASLRCSCGRIFVGMGDKALASSRASFEAHLPGVSKFFGTWSGDETDSELLASVDEIRKPAHLPEKEGK